MHVRPISNGDGRCERAPVIVLVGYSPPAAADQIPSYSYVSPEAAEYLAGMPVKAIGTPARRHCCNGMLTASLRHGRSRARRARTVGALPIWKPQSASTSREASQVEPPHGCSSLMALWAVAQRPNGAATLAARGRRRRAQRFRHADAGRVGRARARLSAKASRPT